MDYTFIELYGRPGAEVADSVKLVVLYLLPLVLLSVALLLTIFFHGDRSLPFWERVFRLLAKDRTAMGLFIAVTVWFGLFMSAVDSCLRRGL